MFVVNEDNSIYATRGDIVFLTVTAEDDGKAYYFQPGDVLRIKVYGKKDAEKVVLQKDFPVTEETEKVEIFLTEEDTKIDEVISKPKDYWYEVELNPLTNPQTIIGYDEDGPKVFKLFPEGADIPPHEPIKPEDVPVVDDELDMTSTRPVENQAVARAVVGLRADFDKTNALSNETASALSVERARLDNLIAADGTKLAQNLEYLDYITETTQAKIGAEINSDGVFATIKVNHREANLIYGGTDMDVFIIPDEGRPIDTGLIHTADGMEYRINYDTTNKRYVLNLKAQNDVTVAPSGAGTVSMTYALGDYEVIDGRVSAGGHTHASIGNHIRDVNNQLDERIYGLQIEGYEASDYFKDIKGDSVKVGGHFFRYPDSNAMESDQWNFYAYPVKAGERYRIKTYTVSAGRAVAFMAMEWDAAEIDPAIGCYPVDASGGEIVDVVVTVPAGAVQMLVNENPSQCEAYIGKFISRQFLRRDTYNSPLKGKTLVCCGDSITEAVNPDGGYFDNYAEIVANRLGMSCYKDGVGGSTMAYVNGKSFSNARYLNVPAFDYLTIWFGWNDAAYSELGTISDTGKKTFYGAYKMVLEHFITNNPTKKIGVIVPYGSEAVDPFAQAVREVSDMYGVPCLDLKNHNKCSLLWGTANTAQLARRSALTYDGTHPNQDGYDFLATMYEQFLLSL